MHFHFVYEQQAFFNSNIKKDQLNYFKNKTYVFHSFIIFQIKAYHTKYYQPENLTLSIAGKITPDEVFKVLLPYEEKILKKQKEKVSAALYGMEK